jgi:oligopeptide/dipeptide ABC transporter ATP-binding protein
MEHEAILSVEHVSASFSARKSLADAARRQQALRVHALDDVSLELGQRETIGIVGESGSGKSTLAKVLVRLVEPDSGSVRFQGRDVLALAGEELREVRRRLQMIYQDPYDSLNPQLTVQQALSEPAHVHGYLMRNNRDELVGSLLDQVGLARRLANRRPRELSGGQRQRVAIARALAVRPEVLIADEAVSALDVSIQAQILNLFGDLQHELGLSMLFISHQLSVIGHIADRVAVMYLGRIVEIGSTAEVFEHPAHPYTVALLSAQPGKHRRGRVRKPALSGEIPSPLDVPSGCRFRSRCPLAQPICTEIDPEATPLSETHTAWCHMIRAARTQAGPPATHSAQHA